MGFRDGYETRFVDEGGGILRMNRLIVHTELVHFLDFTFLYSVIVVIVVVIIVIVGVVYKVITNGHRV